MRLRTEVVIDGEAADVFAALTDLPRAAECLPGASLSESGDDHRFAGEFRCRLGPITVAYAGTGQLQQIAPDSGRLIVRARGREDSGRGDADIRIAVQVQPEGTTTRLVLDSDLAIRGKVAELGGSAIGQVSQATLESFASNLAETITRKPSGLAADAQGPETHSQLSGTVSDTVDPPETAKESGERDSRRTAVTVGAIVTSAAAAYAVTRYLIGRRR